MVVALQTGVVAAASSVKVVLVVRCRNGHKFTSLLRDRCLWKRLFGRGRCTANRCDRWAFIVHCHAATIVSNTLLLLLINLPAFRFAALPVPVVVA